MFSSFAKIKVDKSLCQALKAQYSARGYASLDEMIHHLLEQGVVDGSSSLGHDAEVERRLRGLGYIE